MSDAIRMLSALAATAFLVESLSEQILGAWLDKLDRDLKVNIIKTGSSVIGAVVCVMFGLDVLSMVEGVFGIDPMLPEVTKWIGPVLTGVLMGRGAQWFHDLGTKFLGVDQYPEIPY